MDISLESPGLTTGAFLCLCVPLVLTPAELEADVKKELSVNADLVKATGVKAN
jgi:hypothetical protein